MCHGRLSWLICHSWRTELCGSQSIAKLISAAEVTPQERLCTVQHLAGCYHNIESSAMKPYTHEQEHSYRFIQKNLTSLAKSLCSPNYVVNLRLIACDRINSADVEGEDTYGKSLALAWKPFAVGWKSLWWDCVAIPTDIDDRDGFRKGRALAINKERQKLSQTLFLHDY